MVWWLGSINATPRGSTVTQPSPALSHGLQSRTRQSRTRVCVCHCHVCHHSGHHLPPALSLFSHNTDTFSHLHPISRFVRYNKEQFTSNIKHCQKDLTMTNKIAPDSDCENPGNTTVTGGEICLSSFTNLSPTDLWTPDRWSPLWQSPSASARQWRGTTWSSMSRWRFWILYYSSILSLYLSTTMSFHNTNILIVVYDYLHSEQSYLHNAS